MSRVQTERVGPGRRADAVRNAQAVVDAAAAVFAEEGVDAPIRRIAARAGVGMATVLRHYPDRQALIADVYRSQVESCAAAAPSLLESASSPAEALKAWAGLFVEFLSTKHGLATVMSADPDGFGALHAYFLARLVPAGQLLLDAGVAQGFFREDVPAALMLRAIGNLCVTSRHDAAGETLAMVGVFLDGLARRSSAAGNREFGAAPAS
ncbi:TetR/AcrR family transcriptional regulator [Amnibacterium kyonggiense]|uniref:TetR family transcriptional regulator n=1 Tax=Amnibacterium kyonggiense TaxID=595671 RepID=A0A4R7FRG5_9MICO|nr:TetR family transcriptional regulator [Amnibacterium kyonggiense]TDS80308.1 TetR family transcriptional regulator [Amnibacterium kyonggiense]